MEGRIENGYIEVLAKNLTLITILLATIVRSKSLETRKIAGEPVHLVLVQYVKPQEDVHTYIHRADESNQW